MHTGKEDKMFEKTDKLGESKQFSIIRAQVRSFLFRGKGAELGKSFIMYEYVHAKGENLNECQLPTKARD